MTVGLTSLVAPATDHVAREVGAQMAAHGVQVEWIGGSWHRRLAAVESGAASLVWLCGLLLAERLAAGWRAEAIAALPSPRARAHGQPVYFGDVVVAAGGPIATLGDLPGARLAFNERASLSGWTMMARHLREHGRDMGSFAALVETGAHAGSLEAVLDGRADVACIDSTITDEVGVPEGVRVLASLGPYPAPPFAATTPEGAAVAHVRRLTPVAAEVYPPLLAGDAPRPWPSPRGSSPRAARPAAPARHRAR